MVYGVDVFINRIVYCIFNMKMKPKFVNCNSSDNLQLFENSGKHQWAVHRDLHKRIRIK